MAEKETDIFNKHVNEWLYLQLECLEEKINAITQVDSIKDVSDLLKEANSIISFLCGEDEDQYELLRYRLFCQSDGHLVVTQGDEIDVDIRAYNELEGIDNNDYDFEDDQANDLDDEDDGDEV